MLRRKWCIADIVAEAASHTSLQIPSFGAYKNKYELSGVKQKFSVVLNVNNKTSALAWNLYDLFKKNVGASQTLWWEPCFLLKIA